MVTESEYRDLAWVLEKAAAVSAKIPILKPPTAGAKRKDPEQLKLTRDVEFKLWQKWKSSGEKPEHLDPLLQSLKPVIEKRAKMYKSTNIEIPHAAIDFEHKQRAVDALRSFDPARGTKLATYLTIHLKRGDRYIKTLQNVARIPENISGKIGKYRAVKSDLEEKLGHEPDAHHLSQETGFSLREIKRLEKDVRTTLIASGSAQDLSQEAHISDNFRAEEVKLQIYPELTPKEKVVYEYIFGMYGKPKIEKTGELAKKLKMGSPEISRLKRGIINKMKQYMRD